MRNISDVIETYIKKAIDESEQRSIELKRSELADYFQCVPSQINYVIRTRFTVEKGYVVESKRGGGGYIRIIKVKPDDKADLVNQMTNMIGSHLSQQAASNMIGRLYEEDVINKREASLMLNAIHRQTLNVHLPLRDELRAQIFKAMLIPFMYKESSDER
ncbi:CtsR family transcriptional regulator [Texcoconibacillus texcoconensis]|uniref:Transcriptional regulator CtsR n=1 Tax=Texcoconibacillus texcoconensis TaxID=1095777 RepID=A0A840QUU5_9BACI|nr:CtsR family transcriptional regulator [Texcoconibacillus texcoconensis]MBB5175017.1 transcriptional regulator CtsR [Texcoconibacillus texcoconensis]